MNERNRLKAATGRQMNPSPIPQDSTHEAETSLLNVREEVGSENDKIAKDRYIDS